MIGGINGYIAGAVLVLAGLAGAYLQGRQDGGNSTRAEYAARDAKAQAEAADAERAIADSYRKQEQAKAQAIAILAQTYEKRIAANETAHAVAASIRMFDTGSRIQTCGDSTTKVATDTSTTNPRGTELSQEFAAFLKSEASRADKVAEKLNFCIGVLEEERK